MLSLKLNLLAFRTSREVIRGGFEYKLIWVNILVNHQYSSCLLVSLPIT